MRKTPVSKSFDLGDGRTVTIETGKLATQAHGSVVVSMGNTMILATVVSDKDPKDVDFLPLTVDYREKYAASGKFPGGFFKREARPSEYEILNSRLVDRALRPLFPDHYHCETQMMISLISSDENEFPDALACFAASCAISVSDIPFNGPVSEVRVGRVDGKFLINPTKEDHQKCDIDLIIAGTANDIVMVEGEMDEISEEEMVEAIRFAHEAIKVQCQVQKELEELWGSTEKREVAQPEEDDELKTSIKNALEEKVFAVTSSGIQSKSERSEAFNSILEEYKASFSEEELEEKEFLIGKYFHDLEKDVVRSTILNERKRLDGRKPEDIRSIWSEVNYLPSTHGSSIFTRGETQSLTTVTLGSKMDEQIIDGVVFKGTSRFLLHYNFPSFSTGEARPNRGTSRREVGHGNLALRALKRMLPDEIPYTVRIVSDILESNGSSSMATVCAGSMALMDAGIKIKKGVSGIAMGLITDPESGKFAVLSDILGDEDHLGDMDFKVTGTKDGITACQMDIKINGLSYEILTQALLQAKQGREHILNEMNKTISEPKDDYKPHAPRIIKMNIPKEFIGAVIGPGGKVIQEIQAETGATIYIEEVDEIGIIDIIANNKDSIDKAIDRIKGITAMPEIGEVYEATVKRIMPYGAFVEFLPGKEGLLHISEISWKRLENMEGVMDTGDKVKVKLLDVDKMSGKFKLSRKVLLDKPDFSKSKQED